MKKGFVFLNRYFEVRITRPGTIWLAGVLVKVKLAATSYPASAGQIIATIKAKPSLADAF